MCAVLIQGRNKGGSCSCSPAEQDTQSLQLHGFLQHVRKFSILHYQPHVCCKVLVYLTVWIQKCLSEASQAASSARTGTCLSFLLVSAATAGCQCRRRSETAGGWVAADANWGLSESGARFWLPRNSRGQGMPGPAPSIPELQASSG